MERDRKAESTNHKLIVRAPTAESVLTARYQLPSGLAVKAHWVFPEHLPFLVAGQRFPSEEMVDRVGETAFRMRIVGCVHQYVVTQEVGHHLNHIFAFVHFEACEETAAGYVFADLVLERRGRADVMSLIFETPRPERQPSATAFEYAEADRGIAIHDAGTDEGAHRAHPAPWMGGGAAEEQVVPHIAIAWEVRRGPGEAVMSNAKPLVGTCRPN